MMEKFIMEKLSDRHGSFLAGRLFMFALIMGLACLVLTPLAMAADNAGDMPAGTWATNPRFITFGSYNNNPLVWRVLEVKENDLDSNVTKTAFLLLDDLLRDINGNVIMRRYDTLNNSFPNSEIKGWLNDGANGFLNGLITYQADILDTTYRPDNASFEWHGGPASDTSKVFLLSVGEADNESYFIDNSDRAIPNTPWRLRSPGFDDEEIAACIIVTGNVARNGFHISELIGVRPALKINLSPSSAFAPLPVSYGLTVKINDGDSPIACAKISLSTSPAARNTNNFSNSDGIARFSNVTPGKYNVTISKPGYSAETRLITIPSAPVISLTPNPTAIPDRVKFGKYNGNPIEWKVLDIVNSKALLFAGALFLSQFDMATGTNIWEDSSLRVHLNNSDSDTEGFLQDANFTAAEAATIDSESSATGDRVFLFSTSEVNYYLPDTNIRWFDDKEWLTRTPFGMDDVEAISPDGEFGDIVEAFDDHMVCWVRPAMWVDLSMLTYDSSTNSLKSKE